MPLFGALNEVGVISHVPTGIPGQNFTFNHARFAIPGPDIASVLSRQGQGQVNALGSMLSQVDPIYRPDFQTMGGSVRYPTMRNLGMNHMQHGQPQIQMHMPMGSNTMLPNFASVMAQRMNRNDASAMFSSPTVAQMPMWGNMSPSGMGSTAPHSHPTASEAHRQDRDDDDGHKKKRRKRDPTLPTPARFAWNFYFRDQYTKIRNSEPGEHSNVQKAFTDIGLDLGKKWKSLSKEEKAPYIKMAEQDRERYEREMRQRLSGAAPASVAVSDSTTPASAGSEGDSDEENEKVGIVLQVLEVEDKRDEAERVGEPSEGELVADVLVVDDDEVFLKIVRHKLIVNQKNPPRVLTVKNLDKAKRMILDEKNKFGTILIDKHFEGQNEDGIESLRCIREHGYSGRIVGVTGSTDEKTKQDFAKFGAESTFIKGSSNFYDDLVTLVNVHSKNVEMMESDLPFSPITDNEEATTSAKGKDDKET